MVPLGFPGLLIGKSTYFVEADPALFLSYWCEKLAITHALAAEKEQAVAPPLADVATIVLEVDVPSEWPCLVD